MTVLDRGIDDRHQLDSDLDYVDRLVNAVAANLEYLNRERRDRIKLVLSARLCEMVAYDNAGKWSPSSVADLILISAQIERTSMRRSQLD